jgi:raffinose/stachyose/melibiose transport system permease protein
MASTLGTTEAVPVAPAEPGVTEKERGHRGPDPYWFYLPAAIIYAIFFIVPTVVSFYFSFTRWDLFTSHWIGLKNYVQFFNEQALIIGLRNTLIYAFITSGLKVVIGMLLAVLLTSKIIARGYLRSVIFFPVLVSTVGVGLTFTVLMNPEQGRINQALGVVGINGPRLAHKSELGDLFHCPGRCLERRGPRHGDLHRRHCVHTVGLLRGGRG